MSTNVVVFKPAGGGSDILFATDATHHAAALSPLNGGVLHFGEGTTASGNSQCDVLTGSSFSHRQGAYWDVVTSGVMATSTWGTFSPKTTTAETLIGQTWYKDNALSEKAYTISSGTCYLLDAKVDDSGGGTLSRTMSGAKIVSTIGGGTHTYGVGTVKYTATANPGFHFVRWETNIGDVADNILTIKVGTQDVQARAYFSANPTLAYDANGGDSTPSSQTAYGDVTIAPAITRVGHIFLGWKIGDTIYQPGDTYNLVNDATAVAQWSGVHIINEDSSIGTISLFDVTDNRTVATETNGEIIFSAVENHQYRIDCMVNDPLYVAQGVYVEGEYVHPYTFRYTGGEVEVAFSYRKKTTYKFETAVSPEGGGSVAVVAPSAPHEIVDGKNYYVEGTAIILEASPAIGYAFELVKWLDTSDNDRAKGDTTPSGNRATLTAIAFPVRASCIFTKTPYTFSVGTHEASAEAITQVSASRVESSALPDNQAYYGDTVTFSATVESGYSFAGWFDVTSGELVSADNPYSHTIIGDVSLVAKAKVTCSLALQYPSGGTSNPSLTKGGAAYTPGTPFDVILGDSFSYAVNPGERTPGTPWQFDGWYSDPDVPTTVQAYGAADTIAPTAALSITAVLKANAQKTVEVYLVKMGEGGAGNVIVPNTDYPDAATLDENVPATGVARLLGSGGSNVAHFTFTVNGTQFVRLNVAESLQIGSEPQSLFGMIRTFQEQYPAGGGTTPIPPEEEIITKNASAVFLLYKDASVYIFYGMARAVRVSLDYANISGSSMGEIAIVSSTDPDAQRESDTAIVAMQGTQITLAARAKNGYRFAGWYLNARAAGDPAEARADAEMVVSVERTIYALFVEDASQGVFVWEGAQQNKMMEWVSKTFASTMSFNPSACRIDSRAYPPERLKVEMFSSPDAEPTQTADMRNINSQDARRLPFRRPERYLRVTVNHTAEVDAVFVATSMGGLRL